MNELKQNQVIAEELARRLNSEVYIDSRRRCVEHSPVENCKGSVFECSDYFTRSLESCRMFEETLTIDEEKKYATEIFTLVADGAAWGTADALCKCVMATPVIRCKAFLRTIGKWESA